MSDIKDHVWLKEARLAIKEKEKEAKKKASAGEA